ncbi:acyl transferase/acyl hydrolase/lysophospholipase, partial [Cladorrhinum sp. PSN259]
SLILIRLDGGGIRGYSSLMMLEKLMGVIQKKLGLPSPPLPCECFDIIGGTSTGGIIAILLGRLRMSTAEALSAYSRVAELAFTPKVYVPFRPPTLPKYSDAKLVEAIQRELKSARASNGDSEALFADGEAVKTIVLAITKVNVNAGPTLFKTYDVEPAWKDCTIWEVARATSAATTFFGPIKTGRDNIAFIDAAFGYNNPCEVLLAEADRAIPGRQTSCIVSIGTGLKGAIGVSPKPFTLLKALTNMATNSLAVHSRLQETFSREQPQKYWRFDEDVAISEIKMDNWKMLQSIAGHTHTTT